MVARFKKNEMLHRRYWIAACVDCAEITGCPVKIGLRKLLFTSAEFPVHFENVLSTDCVWQYIATETHFRDPISENAVQLFLILYCSLSLLLSHPGLCQEKEKTEPIVTDPELRKELLERVDKDQAIRKEIIQSGVIKPDKVLLDRMKTIDEQNTLRIKEVVRKTGWPSTAQVGVDGANAAFLLVQHSDLKTQKEMLPLLEKAFRNGDVPGQNYALLVDRVLVGEGKPQVYGTQSLPFDQWVDQEPVLAPIEDEQNANQRRQSVGLPTLDEYRKLLKQMYFPKK